MKVLEFGMAAALVASNCYASESDKFYPTPPPLPTERKRSSPLTRAGKKALRKKRREK